jgi:hypothetical protein
MILNLYYIYYSSVLNFRGFLFSLVKVGLVTVEVKTPIFRNDFNIVEPCSTIVKEKWVL